MQAAINSPSVKSNLDTTRIYIGGLRRIYCLTLTRINLNANKDQVTVIQRSKKLLMTDLGLGNFIEMSQKQ